MHLTGFVFAAAVWILILAAFFVSFNFAEHIARRISARQAQARRLSKYRKWQKSQLEILRGDHFEKEFKR